MTYPEMKDSGVEWIGQIPADWTIGRIKDKFSLRNERNYEPLEDVNLISLYTDKGVVQHSDLTETTGNRAVTADGYKKVHTNDIVVNIILCWMGAVGMSDYDGVTSPAYDVYQPKAETFSKYYHYLFRTSRFNGECFRYGRGIMLMRWRTYSDEFTAIKIPVPPLDIQREIAEFLDAQCSQIDAIIDKAKASIEEYRRWKASVVYQAVTKGLDPDVPMKDSGVSCIGTIPSAAKISRVNFHYEIILGKMLCPFPLDDSYTLEPYYCAANVHFEGIASDELKEMWFNEAEKERYLVRRGDLLVVEGGAGAGGCAIAGETIRSAYIQNSIMIVRPKGKQDIRFLRYLIEMLVNRGYMEYVCNKATIPHFTKEKLAAVPYPLFDENDVVKISDYLDRKCAEIDAIISEKQSLIAELEGYKKSLIYEAVTGKRKVG